MPTQNSDIYSSTYALMFTGAGETWKIGKNANLFGLAGAVQSTYANSKLINKGSLVGNAFGVYYDVGGLSGTYKVVNKEGASISGSNGVYVSDFLGSLLVQNDGDIFGATFGVFVAGSSDVKVMNDGSITSGIYAIFVAASSAGANGTVVDNNGIAKASLFGVYLSGPSTVMAKVTNHEDGVIGGGLAGVFSPSPVDVKNEGKIIDVVWTSDYADKVVNKGKILGDVQLGAGIDTYKAKGKAKAGLVDTQDGNDLVTLGDKKDMLLFDSALNAATNVDSVKKFVSGKDMVYLDNDIFPTIPDGVLSSTAFHEGTSAASATDRIIYDKASGALYYDPDGLGGASQVQFATFDPGTKLKASDFMIGEYTIMLV